MNFEGLTPAGLLLRSQWREPCRAPTGFLTRHGLCGPLPADMHADLILICHAPTEATRRGAFPTDDRVDPRGLACAAAMAASVAGADHAWCAPSVAAGQTAVALGLVASQEPALRDCDVGHWAGRRAVDLARAEPEAFAQWMADPSAAPHGGEALVDVIERVGGWLDRCRATPGTTVAVTHVSVIRAAVVAAVDSTPRSFWHLDIGPLSRTALRSDGRRWALRSLTEDPRSAETWSTSSQTDT